MIHAEIFFLSAFALRARTVSLGLSKGHWKLGSAKKANTADGEGYSALSAILSGYTLSWKPQMTRIERCRTVARNFHLFRLRRKEIKSEICREYEEIPHRHKNVPSELFLPTFRTFSSSLFPHHLTKDIVNATISQKKKSDFDEKWQRSHYYDNGRINWLK